MKEEIKDKKFGEKLLITTLEKPQEDNIDDFMEDEGDIEIPEDLTPLSEILDKNSVSYMKMQSDVERFKRLQEAYF